MSIVLAVDILFLPRKHAAIPIQLLILYNYFSWIGLSSYTTAAHIARATLEAIAFQTRAIIESMELDSGVEMKHLKVDGGVTNGDIAMEILADVGGFEVVRPEMREYVHSF